MEPDAKRGPPPLPIDVRGASRDAQSGASAAKEAPSGRRRLGWALTAVLGVVIVAFLAWRIFFRPVTVAAATVGTDVHERVFGLGVVGARVESNVGFKVSGVLTELDADQGDRVHVGQVLARLDARDVEAQVAVARANTDQARANLDKADADVTSTMASLTNATRISARDARLIRSGAVSTEQAQTDRAAARVASANVAVARSAVKLAKAALRSARAQQAFEEATLANYTLYAPFDAWVVSRNLELGSTPNPGQSVFTLVRANTVWVVAYVDERLAGRLRVGEPAEIALRSEPGRRFSGHVARIEIQSDAVNEERVVDVAFDRVPDPIHLAEQAEVYITTGELKRAVLVPRTAVTHFADGGGTVWILDHGRLARQAVTFGPQLLDGRLPLLSGLPEGAQVVLPHAGLHVGEAARVAAQGPR